MNKLQAGLLLGLITGMLALNAGVASSDPGTGSTPNFPVVISTYAAISPGSSPASSPAGPAAVAAAAATAAVAAPAQAPEVSSAPVVAQVTLNTQALTPPALSVPSLGGKPVTLDLKDMDVVEVLKMLSKQNNVNLIIDKNVSGRVTLLLNNVEFWEAFTAILSSRDLAFAKNADLVEVMSGQDYERTYGTPFNKRTERAVIDLQHARAKTVKEMLEPIKSKVGTIAVGEVTNTVILDDNPLNIAEMRKLIERYDVPREMTVFRLNYATAEEMEPKLAPYISKETGSLQIDKRSNSLIIEDNPARVQQITAMIKAFDVRNKCVLIEAKIMQVLINKRFQAGVNWEGINWTTVLGALNGYRLQGNLVQNLQLVPQATLAPGNVTAPGITASLGILQKPDFNAVFNLLSTIGTTNLLSSPRIMAMDHNEAKIHVGSKAAKITKTVLNVGSTTSNPVTTENVEFLDTGVKLSVTPTIGSDGVITMKVKPEVSSVESTITTAEGSSIPIIRTSMAEASLVVKDGVTVVIGGLIEDAKVKTDTEVPILGRIPLIGYLFRSRDSQVQKTELVIFLTPHIVNGDEITPEVQSRLDIKPDGTPIKKGFFRRLFGRK